MKKLSTSKTEEIRKVIADLRDFRFCGPGDDPDAITNVTLGYRYLLIQLQRLASPLLSKTSSSHLNSLSIEIDHLYQAFEVAAELNSLILDIEDALDQEVETGVQSTTKNQTHPVPVPVCSIVGEILGSTVYNHRKLETIFYEAGARGSVPEGNCVVKCQTWLKRLHTEADNPLAVLGKLIEEFMEVDVEYYTTQDDDRKRISEVLAKFGLSYRQGGIVYGQRTASPTRSLQQQLRDRNIFAIDDEFARCLENVDSDPRAATTAASSILESLFKVYIEDNGLDLPSKQTIIPLWRVVSKHLGVEPSVVEDEDLKKILSGLTSIVDGIGSLRTHIGSAHGRGRRTYRLQPRHARLTVHASHTLVGFLLDTWDARTIDS